MTRMCMFKFLEGHIEYLAQRLQPAICIVEEQSVIMKRVQVGKDQEKAQSERDSHSKNRGGKKPNQQSGTYTMKHIVSRMSLPLPPEKYGSTADSRSENKEIMIPNAKASSQLDA